MARFEILKTVSCKLGTYWTIVDNSINLDIPNISWKDRKKYFVKTFFNEDEAIAECNKLNGGIEE